MNIVIHTTSKYLPIVDVQLKCIERYAPELLKYGAIYIACEGSQEFLKKQYSSRIQKIPLLAEESGFLESRVAALKYIVEDRHNPILMLQDDFWIDRPVRKNDLEELLLYFRDERVKSIRVMPCPGPVGPLGGTLPHLRGPPHPRVYVAALTEKDTYRFSFQATIWNHEAVLEWFETILRSARSEFRISGLPASDWTKFCIRHNVTENQDGQALFLNTMMGPEKIHLAVRRQGDHPNAVNLAPIPYRPTAVVQGKLEPWAKEFAIREGFQHLEGWY
jgi:hypothetical protein